jgi:hypothetical protein
MVANGRYEKLILFRTIGDQSLFHILTDEITE